MGAESKFQVVICEVDVQERIFFFCSMNRGLVESFKNRKPLTDILFAVYTLILWRKWSTNFFLFRHKQNGGRQAEIVSNPGRISASLIKSAEI